MGFTAWFLYTLSLLRADPHPRRPSFSQPALSLRLESYEEDSAEYFPVVCPEVTILVPAFDRPSYLKNTLQDLTEVNWMGCEIELTICLDKGATSTVVETADDFVWEHGPTRVRSGRSRGLLFNVLNCFEGNSDPHAWAFLVEDDVKVSTTAFQHFMVLLPHLRTMASVVGVAFNHLAVDQYCTAEDHYPNCVSDCSGTTGKHTAFGSLICQSDREWLPSPIPSSWGTIVQAWFWNKLRDYATARSLTLTSGATFVRDSMSNEWQHSWKRFAYELTVGNDLYFIHSGVTLATTLRASGVHTTTSSTFESLARCLFVHRVVDAPVSTLRIGTPRGPCGIKRNFSELFVSPQLRGHSIDLHYNLSSRYLSSVRLCSSFPMLCINRATFAVASSAIIMNGTLRAFLRSLGRLGAVVVLFAPPKVCRDIHEPHVACLGETACLLDGLDTPELSCMLSHLIPFERKSLMLGFVNSDIVFPRRMADAIDAILNFPKWKKHSSAVVGRRTDCYFFDGRSVCEEHSLWGIDYFLFNAAGLRQATVWVAGFGVGRVLWDTSLLARMILDENWFVVDVSNAVTVKHLSSSRPSKQSHQRLASRNRKLAISQFKAGSLEWVRHKLSPTFQLNTLSHFPSRDVLRQWKLMEWVHRRKHFAIPFLPQSFVDCMCAFAKDGAIEFPPRRGHVASWCNSSRVEHPQSLFSTRDFEVMGLVVRPRGLVAKHLRSEPTSFPQQVRSTPKFGSLRCCLVESPASYLPRFELYKVLNLVYAERSVNSVYCT